MHQYRQRFDFPGLVGPVSSYTGRQLSIDLCSVLSIPSLTRRWSFLSQALGLMVDLDIGTASLRWMGDTRFMLGFLKGLAVNKTVHCRLRMKVVESDKVEMARVARELNGEIRGTQAVASEVNPLADGMKGLDLDERIRRTSSSAGNSNGDGHEEEDEGPLLEAKPLEADESWTTIESTPNQSIKVTSQSEASNKGAAGGWVDGEGILYA